MGVYVKADSGFDSGGSSGGGYSGGGGYSSGGGGYSGGSYHSDYHSSSSSNSGKHTPKWVVYLFSIGMFLYILLPALEDSKNNRRKAFRNITKDIYNPKEANLKELKEKFPEFDIAEFREEAFNIYVEIQQAWMNFNYNKLRQYTTDEMYNMYESQLETLKVKGRQNIMSNYKLHKFKINKVDITKDDLTIVAYMQISLLDYIEDQNGVVVSGNKEKDILINYEMTFIRTIDEKENVCPNCRAKLPNDASVKCPYCESIITPKSHDFVLSKKLIKDKNKKDANASFFNLLIFFHN